MKKKTLGFRKLFNTVMIEEKFELCLNLQFSVLRAEGTKELGNTVFSIWISTYRIMTLLEVNNCYWIKCAIMGI